MQSILASKISSMLLIRPSMEYPDAVVLFRKSLVPLAASAAVYVFWKGWRRHRHYSKMTKDIAKNDGLETFNLGPLQLDIPPTGDRELFVRRLGEGGSAKTSAVPGVTYCRFTPIEPTLVVHDQKAAEAVLKHTRKARVEEYIDETMFGAPVLLGMKPGPWRKRRRLLNKCFHLDSYYDAINNQCKTLVANIKNLTTTPQTYTNILFRRHAVCVAMDMSLEVLFGRSLDIQKCYSRTVDLPEWARDIEYMISTWSYLWLHPLYYNSWGFKLFDNKRYNKFRGNRERIYKFIGELVQEHIDSPTVESVGSDRLNIIESLVKLLEDGEITKDELIPELFLFIGAGYDTSSSSIADGMAWVAKSETVQEKLSAEINEYIPEDTAPENLFINSATLQKMTYLDCVLKEILRYCGPLSANGRCIEAPVKFDNGFVLDASPEHPVDVLILMHQMNMSTDTWGKDADIFRPERHLEGKREHISFSRGPRKCIGENLAKTMMKIELIYLFRHFQFKCDESLTGRQMVSEPMLKFKIEPVLKVCAK